MCRNQASGLEQLSSKLKIYTKDHLDFRILGMSGDFPGTKGIHVNMCEQQRVCHSPTQLLKPSTSPFQKYRLLPASFFYIFLRSSLFLEAWDGGGPSSLGPWALLWSLPLTGSLRSHLHLSQHLTLKSKVTFTS